jgi:hypothetical protein
MNLSKPLPSSICLEYQDEECIQTIDYEHILFRCRKIHEHGHLFRGRMLNTPSKDKASPNEKQNDCFTRVQGRCMKGQKKPTLNPAKAPSTRNSFEILNQVPRLEDIEAISQQTNVGNVQNRVKEVPEIVLEQVIPIPVTNPMGEDKIIEDGRNKEVELYEKEFIRINPVSLEESYRKKELLSLSPDQLWKVHKVYLNSRNRATSIFGVGFSINKDPLKESCKLSKDDKRHCRKSTQQLIHEVGSFIMVNSR